MGDTICKDPSEELKRLAVKNDYDAIKYMENPSEDNKLKL